MFFTAVYFKIYLFLILTSFFSFFLSFIIFFSRNIIYTVLGLIFIFLNSSIFLFILGFHFFSFIYILVYIGAIVIFFLFILLLLDLREETSWFMYSQSKFFGSDLFSYFFLLLNFFFFYYFIKQYLVHASLYDSLFYFRSYLLNFFSLPDVLFEVTICKIFVNMHYFNWFGFFFFFNNDYFILGYFLYTKFFVLLVFTGLFLFIVMFCSINIFLLKSKIFINT